MRSQVTLQEQERYWNVVAECLCKFLGYSKARAQKEAIAFRESLREECKRAGGVGDFVYHEEPYRIACGIAEKSIDRNNWAAYMELKEEFFKRAKGKASLRLNARKSTARNVVAAAKKTSKKIAG